MFVRLELKMKEDRITVTCYKETHEKVYVDWSYVVFAIEWLFIEITQCYVYLYSR